MYWSPEWVKIVIVFTAVNIVHIFLLLVSYQDQFEGFVYKHLNSRKVQYDYIVVGSGSAGSIVARRLAQNGNISVLLLEAGSHVNRLLQIPFLGVLMQDSVYDWQYRTVPQKKACLGLENRVSHWPMGKGIGGTSILNNMLYTRAHVNDFANWYKNKTSYNYEVDVLPYLNKLESYNVYTPEKSTVISENLPFRSSISDYIMDAAKYAGYSIFENIYSQAGFFFPMATIHNGQRWTSANQMLKNRKSNLDILSNAVVEKVLLKGGYEAYGVKYLHLGDNRVATASKGVVLSAGVIGSPKILMLSGIGPTKHLKNVKIESLVDLPVGDNLQDHVTTGIDLVTIDTPIDMGFSDLLNPYSIYRYFVNSEGPLTTTACDVMAFFTSGFDPAPDLQLMVLPVGVHGDKGVHLRNLIGIGDALWSNYFAKINKTSFTILPVVLHPKSRGTVRLRSKNPDTPPLIDPNYLSDPYDIDMLIRGISRIKELIDAKPMKLLGAQMNDLIFPGCESFKFDSRSYWECYVKHFTLTSYHPVGTCSMGQVVDYDFKVKGTNNLYVVDGSVLPSMPSGNPIAAIMMMAEKAADIIMEHKRLSENVCHSQRSFY